MPIVSGFVLMATILFPLVELMALLYLLLPLRQGRRPAQFRFFIRVVHAVRPWGISVAFRRFEPSTGITIKRSTSLSGPA